MNLFLEKKVALVTGASRGLGFAAARLLAMEGAQVAINSRNSTTLNAAVEKIIQETGAKIIPLAGDVTSPGIPENLVDQAARQFGGLDILIANAGGPQSGAFESLDDNAWYEAFELSLMSQVRLIRSALPYLRKSKTPSVLTVTSISVKQPIPNLILSNSIRAATAGLTKSLSLELGNQGIRFNSILPGWTDTERVKELLARRAHTNNTSIEEEYQKQAQESPLGRLALPEEFARAAVFLVSPAASYINGIQFPVDGGSYKGTF